MQSRPFPKDTGAQVDGFGRPYYPAILDSPDLIERISIGNRDAVQACNIAHLRAELSSLQAHVAKLLENGGTTIDQDPEEIIELGCKSADLAEKGVLLSTRQLLGIATRHGLPVLSTRVKGRKHHYMSGCDWRILTQKIGHK